VAVFAADVAAGADVFFVPLSVATAELKARFKGEGGPYWLADRRRKVALALAPAE